MDRVYEQHCIGGPYVLRAPNHLKTVHEAERWLKERRAQVFEIGRQLANEIPGRALVDVTGPVKVRSYPEKRVIHDRAGVPVVAEQFWVPAGDPHTWSVRSEATQPLWAVDFRESIPQAYKLRVLLIDPAAKMDGRGAVVDMFRKTCLDHGIELQEDQNEGSHD
jgi:hypothetical protein